MKLISKTLKRFCFKIFFGLYLYWYDFSICLNKKINFGNPLFRAPVVSFNSIGTF